MFPRPHKTKKPWAMELLTVFVSFYLRYQTGKIPPASSIQETRHHQYFELCLFEEFVLNIIRVMFTP